MFYARIVSMMKAKLDHWVILASIIMKQAVLNMPTYETAIANANKSISLRFFSFSDKKPSFLLHHSLENMIKEPFWKLTQSWCFKITKIVSYYFHAKNLHLLIFEFSRQKWAKIFLAQKFKTQFFICTVVEKLLNVSYMNIYAKNYI